MLHNKLQNLSFNALFGFESSLLEGLIGNRVPHNALKNRCQPGSHCKGLEEEHDLLSIHCLDSGVENDY
jgi:hypothetical protein